MTLYEILGVAPTATLKEIAAAYRRASLRAHPDAGGSDEAFCAVKDAFDVLSDPARRARYDETGDAQATPPDEREARVIAMVNAAFASAMQSGQAQFFGINGGGFERAMRDFVLSKIANCETHMAAARQGRDALKRMSKRIKRKDGQPSPISKYISEQIAGNNMAIADMMESREDMTAAIRVIEEHDFLSDQAFAYDFTEPPKALT